MLDRTWTQTHRCSGLVSEIRLHIKLVSCKTSLIQFLLCSQLAVNKAKTVLEKFYNLPILYVNESQKLAQSTYEFASKFGLTYYDASFISLASQFGAILVTDNIKHQGKVK